MRRLAPLLLLLGCGSRTEIVLRYHLTGITLDDLVRVETLVSVDPADGRHFFADQPYRSVATGVGIEVRDFNGTGEREVLLTQDVTLGYRFGPSFIYTLLPPSNGMAPPLVFKSRAMAADGTIGVVGPLPGHFGPEVSLSITLTDQRCAGASCSASEACCNEVCMGVVSDLQNCGACGNSCGQSGDTCTGGTCRCAGGSACTGASLCCAGRGCINVANDPFNCGTCGHACNPGETCSAGQCACGGGSACGDGVLCCNDGTCSTNGKCPCGATECGSPSVCCDDTQGLCADVSSSSENCGSCGNQCAAPLTCVGGACACNGVVCAMGDSCCTAGCRNLDDDPQNCGACGNDCGAGSTCVAGQCTCGGGKCAAGQICCDSTCVDPNGSSAHCGSCEVSCKSGEDCGGGMCSCGAAHCVGNETCCADGCFDLQTSSTHCGSSCSAPGCASGYACVMGSCQQTTCVPACANGNTCVGTSCMCGNSAACAAGQTCCSGSCFDLQTSHDHCNSCPHICAVMEQCVGGVCKKALGLDCSSPAECVSGHCADNVCCNNDCLGACQFCALNATKGTCSPVISGGDPHGVCVAHPSSACGTTGQCLSGACDYWPAGTKCVGPMPDSCNPDKAFLLTTYQCDGGDGCVPMDVDCRPYLCVGSSKGDAVCASGACSRTMGLGCVDLNVCTTGATCCRSLTAACGQSYCTSNPCPL